MRNFELTHFATGGTIDSHWKPQEDTAIPLKESCIPSYLKDTVRVIYPVHSETLCMLDSRKLSAKIQQNVARRIAETHGRHVIGTIGTYCMPDVAKYVAKHPIAELYGRIGKRVILTGSLTPITGYDQSDGGFNLGMSTVLLQDENDPSKGLKKREHVFIVMNGSCFVGADVMKDLTSATFATADSQDLLSLNNFLVIPAGGTIDFEIDGCDNMKPRLTSTVPDFLREDVNMSRNRNFNAINPFVKDSRDLTDDDINTIADIIRGSDSDHILITSGILEIARLTDQLRSKLGKSLKDKAIVVTGSRYPLAGTTKTDAPFNLGQAIGTLAFAKPGEMLIAINGSTLDPSQISPENIVKTFFTADELTRIARPQVAK